MTETSKTKENIIKILSLPGNNFCADCNESINIDNGWASLNLGIVCCITCAGIHRSMGAHITKIRSFRLDTFAWTNDIVSLFKKIGGNIKSNKIWEAHLPTYFINPKWDKNDIIRDKFIKLKYESKIFLPPDNKIRTSLCFRSMPIEVRQSHISCLIRGDKKWKKNEFAQIHSRWFSRFTSNKKLKSIQKIDLTQCNIVINDKNNNTNNNNNDSNNNLSDHNISYNDGYELCIYEDPIFIVDNDILIKNNQNERESKINYYKNVHTNDGPLLRIKIYNKDKIKCFKEYCNWIQDLRMTINYYRVFDQFYEFNTDSPQLKLNFNNINIDNECVKLGFAKINWKSKCYFMIYNGYLYSFKQDIFMELSNNNNKKIFDALNAYDLQIIDIVLDEGGQRSGSTNSILIIREDDIIPLKFKDASETLIFFTKLRKGWRDTRGRYTVNYMKNPPIIQDEFRDRNGSMVSIPPKMKKNLYDIQKQKNNNNHKNSQSSRSSFSGAVNILKLMDEYGDYDVDSDDDSDDNNNYNDNHNDNNIQSKNENNNINNNNIHNNSNINNNNTNNNNNSSSNNSDGNDSSDDSLYKIVNNDMSVNINDHGITTLNAHTSVDDIKIDGYEWNMTSDNENEFECDICFTVLDTKTEYVDHMKMHGINIDNDEVKESKKDKSPTLSLMKIPELPDVNESTIKPSKVTKLSKKRKNTSKDSQKNGKSKSKNNTAKIHNKSTKTRKQSKAIKISKNKINNSNNDNNDDTKHNEINNNNNNDNNETKLATTYKKLKKSKKKSQKKVKTTGSISVNMATVRYFNLNKKQLTMIQSQKWSKLKTKNLDRLCINSITSNKIKLQISRRIALNKRNEYWSNILNVLQTYFNINDITKHEILA